MPATSPRFTITVKPETDRALKRLAAVQGRPTASIIREYLEGVTPALEDIADAMEAVRNAEASARAELVGSLTGVHDELMPHIEGIMGHFRAIAALGEDAAEDRTDGRTAAERGAARPADPEGQPPLCNTGVVKSESEGYQPLLPMGVDREI
jgi:predicted DNA-binding protein